jgi:dipeptidyl aminopeptidase/acylaminoacyl peptidase
MHPSTSGGTRPTVNLQFKRLVADDLYSLPLVHGVALDAAGARAVYAVTTMNADDDGYVGSIRVISLATSEIRTYTRGTARDTQPRFSPDGSRLLFLSDRGERRQVWLIDVDGGEPYPAPTVPGDVSAAVFSPDGRYVAAVATTDVRRREISRRGWRRIDRIRYRADGAGYLDDFPQLWLIDLVSNSARALTDGSGWIAAPAWSHDGKRIAFAGEHRVQADSLWHTELWTIDLRDAGSPKKICALGGAVEAPAWSPDGSRLAFSGFEDPAGYAIAPLRLFEIDADGSNVRCLTGSSEWVCGNHVLNDLEAAPTVSTPVMRDDGSMLVLGTARGSAGVYRVGRNGAAERLTLRTQTITEFAVAAESLAACASDSASPPEIHVAGTDGGGWRRLSFETKQWREGKTFAGAEPFEADARSGPIEGWHIAGAGVSRRPAILQIHGGPHAAYGCAFFFEFQLLAAAGFDVVFANPRGSQGYGDAFASAIKGDWATPAFEDCMDALDAALKTGSTDARRLGVAGGSYGGYLTAWTIGHTNRFKAAIAMRPAINLVSLWGTSEVGRMLEHELGGRPLDDDAVYRRCSPLTYADAIETPLLLMHSENDYRCPIEQSEQLYAALKLRGAPVEFIRFLGADHGLSRAGPPRLRVARLSAIVDWFEKHLRDA